MRRAASTIHHHGTRRSSLATATRSSAGLACPTGSPVARSDHDVQLTPPSPLSATGAIGKQPAHRDGASCWSIDLGCADHGWDVGAPRASGLQAPPRWSSGSTPPSVPTSQRARLSSSACPSEARRQRPQLPSSTRGYRPRTEAVPGRSPTTASNATALARADVHAERSNARRALARGVNASPPFVSAENTARAGDPECARHGRIGRRTRVLDRYPLSPGRRVHGPAVSRRDERTRRSVRWQPACSRRRQPQTAALALQRWPRYRHRR